jgi:hypothetical protein
LGQTGLTKLYEWQPAALLKPAATIRRATDWDYDGSPGAKWLQGVRIVGDTYNTPKLLTIQGDDGATIANLSMIADGEQSRPFSWPPVVTHKMRILGADDDDWRLMNVQWVWEPEPELTDWWETQFTNQDQPGYYHIREVLIAHRSNADIEFTVTIDGLVTGPYTIPSSGGNRAKTYVTLEAHKGKYYNFRLTSSMGFSLYLPDMEVRVGAWGRSESYLITKPFGDLSRTNGGARI